MNAREKLFSCYEQVKNKINGFVPEVALTLGSGLGGFAKQIDVKYAVKYSDIKGFPVSTVSGHEGQFLFGYIGETPVAAMQGRVHYYEGYDMSDVVIPVRVLKLLGAQKLILTNAAGGINKGFEVGDLMMITNHISTFVPSPLRGENIDELGARFPDMSEIYSKRMRLIMENIAKAQGIVLRQGVYLQTSGPNYETPAEINMFAAIGADAVGMSTACEAMAAKHAGMEVCGISLISNMAAGISEAPLSHEEVKQAGEAAAEKFENLVHKLIQSI